MILTDARGGDAASLAEEISCSARRAARCPRPGSRAGAGRRSPTIASLLPLCAGRVGEPVFGSRASQRGAHGLATWGWSAGAIIPMFS